MSKRNVSADEWLHLVVGVVELVHDTYHPDSTESWTDCEIGVCRMTRQRLTQAGVLDLETEDSVCPQSEAAIR